MHLNIKSIHKKWKQKCQMFLPKGNKAWRKKFLLKKEETLNKLWIKSKSCLQNHWLYIAVVILCTQKRHHHLIAVISDNAEYGIIHCVKSVRIQSYSGTYFPAFGLNMDRYSVSLRIQSECRKIQTKITPNTNTFHAVIFSISVRE